ncbi:MAG: hypothetical protein ACFB21_16225 [Opitutales bacterium]
MGLLAASLGLAGCTSTEKNLAVKEAQLSEVYLQKVEELRDLPSLSLSWDTAKELMLANNLGLRSARVAVVDAEETRERIFLDLLPSLRLSASLSEALTELGSIDISDARLSVFSFISAPGLISMRVRYYAATLSLLRARWNLELQRRQAIIQLRSLFISAEILRQRREDFEVNQRWQRIQGFESMFDLQPEQLEREEEIFQLQRQELALQQQISDLLADHSKAWQLKASDLPFVDYLDQPIDLSEPSRYAVLLRRLQATELEGARLRKLGVVLDYWPDISLSLSMPPLFTYSDGEARSTFALDRLRVNFNSSVNFDTQLRTTYRLRSTKRQIEIMHQRMQQEIASEIQRITLAREELKLTQRRLETVNVRLAALRQAPPATTLEQLRAQLANILLLTQQRANLRMDLAQIEASFWIIDESRWPELDALPEVDQPLDPLFEEETPPDNKPPRSE